MAVQTTVWGVECVGCGKKWDVGQVMQAVVDLASSHERVLELEGRRCACGGQPESWRALEPPGEPSETGGGPVAPGA